VDNAAGLRGGRFLLHLAEFLDAIRPGSFPNMRSLRHYDDRQMKTKTQDVLCCPRRLVPGLMFWLSAAFLSNNADAALGDIVAEYSFPASSLVMSSTRPVIEKNTI